MASCGRHEVGSGSEDGEADRHDPAVQAVMEERQRQREREKASRGSAAVAAAATAAAPAPAAPVIVVPAPLPTSTAEQRAEAERMRAGAAARTRPSGWFHAQEQRRVVLAAAAGDANDDADGRRRRQHLWASQNAAATGAALPNPDDQAGQPPSQQEDDGNPTTATTDLPPCKKCKACPAVALLRQNEPLCGACASEGALGKARAALRGGRLRAGDRVAVALSGGYGSLGMLRALLQLRAWGGASASRPERGRIAFDLECVHVRTSALEWVPLAPAGVVVAVGATPTQEQQQDDKDGGGWWEEGCGGDPALRAAREAAERRADRLERALAEAARAVGYEGELKVVRLEDVFDDDDGEDGGGGKEAGQGAAEATTNATTNLRRLHALLSSVRDRTAREDLAESLRDRLLRRAARLSQCGALATGDTAGTVVRRVIAGAAKGRLFSVPADIAPVAVVGGSSSSSPLVVLRPVRDVTAAELAVSFRHASSSARSPEEEAEVEEGAVEKAAAAPALSSWSSGGSRRAPASLNALTHGFVSAIEAHMPASIYAVLRSAGALQAFPFNEDAAVAAVAAGSSSGAQQRRHRAAAKVEEGDVSPSYVKTATQVPRCRICSSPLLPAEQGEDEEAGGSAAPWPAGSLGALDGGGAQGVCYCCERQVLDLMISSDDDDEDQEEANKEEKVDKQDAADLPGEAERRARRARRRRQLARLRAMLPPPENETTT